MTIAKYFHWGPSGNVTLEFKFPKLAKPKFLEVAQYFSDTLQIHTGTKYNNPLYGLESDFGYL